MKKYKIVKKSMVNGIEWFIVYKRFFFILWENECTHESLREARDYVNKRKGYEILKKEVVEYL